MTWRNVCLSREQDDKWVLFDDDDVTFVNWKDMTGLSTDLCGGKADTQIVAWLTFLLC